MTQFDWPLVLGLAVGAYLCKMLGLVVVGARRLPPVVDRCLILIPAALITALVVKDTLSVGQELVLDARALGVGAATLAAWRKAPLVVVIVLGAAVTAAAQGCRVAPPGAGYRSFRRGTARRPGATFRQRLRGARC